MTELSRIGLLATLPGETLTRLAERMAREEVPPGTVIVREDDPASRFFVLLSGLASVSQSERGPQGILRPGEVFGEVALLMGIGRTATITAMTLCVVASCDSATFEELVRPLLTETD